MQEKLLNSLKTTLIDLDFKKDWIPEFIKYIEECIEKGAILVILFGSRAKHDFHKDSDIDILIVQPFVMTKDELMERIDKLDFLVFDVFEDGLILYSDMDMDHVNYRLKARKERFSLRRVKSGWNFDAAAEAAGI